MTLPPPLIKVTFAVTFPVDLVDGMLETDFVGLSNVYRKDDARVLYLQPTAEKYRTVLEQLKELEAEGALTYVEENR